MIAGACENGGLGRGASGLATDVDAALGRGHFRRPQKRAFPPSLNGPRLSRCPQLHLSNRCQD